MFDATGKLNKTNTGLPPSGFYPNASLRAFPGVRHPPTIMAQPDGDDFSGPINVSFSQYHLPTLSHADRHRPRCCC